MWDQTIRFLGFLTAFFAVSFMVLYLLNPASKPRNATSERPTTRERLALRLEIAARLYADRYGPEDLRREQRNVQIQPYGDIETYELRGSYREQGVDYMEPEPGLSIADQELIADMKSASSTSRAGYAPPTPSCTSCAATGYCWWALSPRSSRPSPALVHRAVGHHPCRTKGGGSSLWARSRSWRVCSVSRAVRACYARRRVSGCWPGRRTGCATAFPGLTQGAGGRQFDHRGEDISAYVPQILYFLEADPRFDTVGRRTRLRPRRQHRDSPAHAAFAAQALRQFEEGRSTDPNQPGHLEQRRGGRDRRAAFMRFVRADRPGVWYVTTAPEGPQGPRSSTAVGSPC